MRKLSLGQLIVGTVHHQIDVVRCFRIVSKDRAESFIDRFGHWREGNDGILLFVIVANQGLTIPIGKR